MKTSTLILVLSTLSAYPAYSQAAGGYAGAAAASQITAQGSAQALGHAQQTAISQAGAATANASANHNTVTGAAGETSATTAQTENTTLSATRASSFPAELTQKVSSKNARVGDEVVARTTSTAQLAGGTRLPKGTKLMGKVTEVESRSGAQRDGHLAFAFDRAVLHDGRQIPIHAALDSISEAPAVSAMAGGSDEFAGGGAPVALSGGGRASGGLLSGGGVAVPHTGLVSSAASNVASTPARVTSTTGAALQQTVGVVSQTSGSTFGAVSNLPGVMARSSTKSSTILDAKGSNVELSSGTQLMLTAATR